MGLNVTTNNSRKAAGWGLAKCFVGRLACCFMLLTNSIVLPFNAVARDNEIAAEKSTAEPEEITVTGKRPLFQLRQELWRAEKAAYDVFNQFNDEARFKIHCNLHEPTGTRIRTQVCTPEFQLRATREHAQNYFYSFGQFAPMEVQIASQMEAYRRKMREVAEENPEFLEAIIRYSEVRERISTELSPESAAD